MLREVLVASVIVAVLAVLVFVPRWLRSPEPAAQMPTCDVLAGPCRWHSDQGEWVVEAEPLGEGDQGTEFRLQVRAPVAPERFLAVLRGESMYMGEYPVPLMPDDKGGWNAVSPRPSAPPARKCSGVLTFRAGSGRSAPLRPGSRSGPGEAGPRRQQLGRVCNANLRRMKRPRASIPMFSRAVIRISTIARSKRMFWIALST